MFKKGIGRLGVNRRPASTNFKYTARSPSAPSSRRPELNGRWADGLQKSPQAGYPAGASVALAMAEPAPAEAAKMQQCPPSLRKSPQHALEPKHQTDSSIKSPSSSITALLAIIAQARLGTITTLTTTFLSQALSDFSNVPDSSDARDCPQRSRFFLAPEISQMLLIS